MLRRVGDFGKSFAKFIRGKTASVEFAGLDSGFAFSRLHVHPEEAGPRQEAAPVGLRPRRRPCELYFG